MKNCIDKTYYCKDCEVILNDTNWQPSLKKSKTRLCRECNTKRGTKWRADNPEKFKKYASNRYHSNLLKSRRCANELLIKIKNDLFNAYGNKCVICRITDPEVLEIDHIYNNGNEQRKKYQSSLSFYYFLKKNNYPKEEYQLLCRNCNWKKELSRRHQLGNT